MYQNTPKRVMDVKKTGGHMPKTMSTNSPKNGVEKKNG